MAENSVLEFILEGIPSLKTKTELKAVLKEVKERLEKLKVARTPRELLFLTEEEKVALAEGNSDEMIRVNKEKYDYRGVKDLDCRSMAEKWFKAPKPSSTTTNAYHHWRVWNYPPYKTYKGGLIFEKATGKSDPPETPECESEPEWESEDQEEETEEVTVAMAAVRVE